MAILIPHDVKSLIASFLDNRQLKRLVLVDREWKAAGETYLLSRIRVPRSLRELHISGHDAAASWTGLRQLLESQPAKVSWIREMRVVTIPWAIKDMIAILRLVSPYIVSWTNVSACMDPLLDDHCKAAALSHLSLATQPLPALEHLTLHIDGNWMLTLPGVLRMTPNLRSLCLEGSARDLMAGVESEVWPRLDNLTTLSVNTSLQGLESEMIRTILSRCNNVDRLNLKLSPLRYEDQDTLIARLLPIVASPRFGFSTIHCDISWEDGPAPPYWHYEAFSYGRPDDWYEDRLPLRAFSCTDDRITFCPAPWRSTLETFRVITSNGPAEPSGSMTPDFQIGFLPSRTTTGSIDMEMLEIMGLAESATLFEAGYLAKPIPFPPLTSIDRLESLHVQTFVEGHRKLFHCWAGAQCSMLKFGRHDDSYRPGLGEDWIDRPWLSEDGSIEHGYDFSPYNESVPANGSGATGSDLLGPYEFTCYEGPSENKDSAHSWHLPFVLLDYVYSQTEYERMPSRGRTGLTLPPHVWQVLDDWYEGVQSQIIPKPVSPTGPSG